MNIHPIKLSPGEHLSDIKPFKTIGILTNTILHKVVTGCGATTLEMKHTKRNSIIIVPSVPVIEAKVKDHNKKHPKTEHILGVHKGIDIGHIQDYLNSEATYKKILTTPEGFIKKVVEAFVDDIEVMLKEYFLLFDECERIVTDVSYRGKIAAPLDWFFRFDNKAMVSATTLPFSHQGFADFEHYFIEPQYDYSKAIKVINTNNVIESLEAHLKELNSDKQFIFLNSTDAIYATIDTLNIHSESKAFCADKSVAKLISKQYKNASSTSDLSYLGKYNFLTSRYFSALDINLDYKPDVILITDVYSAEHSVLDPQTEVIQIAGRFRNGINSLTHITNFNPAIESKSESESKQYLKGCFETYESIIAMLKKSDSLGSKETLKFFQEQSPIADYYIGDQLNDFMVDNYLYEQRVRGYYQSIENLKAAYVKLDKHFKPEFVNEEYILGDKDRVTRESKKTKREQQWETLRQIDKFKPKPGVVTLRSMNSYTLESNLRSLLYPWLREAYDLLGLEGLEKTGLNALKVNPAVAKAKQIKELKMLAPYVYNQFTEHSETEDTYVKVQMPNLCLKANVSLKPRNSLVLKFFKGRRTSRKGVHVYVLEDKIDLDSLSPFD